MATKAEKERARAIRILTDPEWIKNNPMPMFGVRPDYASQAQADYERLTEMASRWTQSREPYEALQAAAPRTAAEYARAVTEWMNYAPTASPGTITAFVQSNMAKDAPGVQEALAYDAELQSLADAKAQNPGGSAGTEVATASWMEDHTAWLRGITRTLVDTATAPLQAVQGALSGAAGSLGILGADLNGQEADWGQAAWQLAGLNPIIAGIGEAQGAYKAPNPWEQTVAGQTLLDFLGMPTGTTTGEEVTPGFGNVNTGDGWLTADENSGVGLAQRQATYQSARNKFNESWTLGRGLFSMGVDSPDSTLYKVGSGFVDAAVSIFLDPTIIGAKFKISREGIVAARRLAEAGQEAASRTRALAEAANLDDAARLAHETRIAELEAQIAADQKYLDSLTPEQRELMQGLMDDEDALRAARPVDQAERDAWIAAQREQALIPEDSRHFELTGQRDELLDLLAAEDARAARNAARRTERGRVKVSEPDEALIDDLTLRYGPDGLENEFAALADDAGTFIEQYPGGVLTSDALPSVKRGTPYGGTFTTEAGATYTRTAEGQYVFEGAQPFERTLFVTPKDAEAIRIASERGEGGIVNEAGELLGVRVGESKVFDQAAYDDAIANGANDYSARVAAGDASEYVVEARTDPRKGLIPVEFSADGSFHIGEKITKTGRATDATDDTAKWFPAFSAGGESVAAWTGRGAPKVVAVEDALDAEGMYAALRSVLIDGRRGGLKGANQTRRDTLAGYEALLTDSTLGATYGDLFSYAASTGTTKALAEALAQSGVDGISGIRRVTGAGDGGTWWANAADLEVRALPTTVTTAQARQALPIIQADRARIKQQIAALDGEMAKIAADRKDAVAAAFQQYDTYEAAVRAQRLNAATDELPVLREQLMTQAGIHNTPDARSIIDQGKLYDFMFKGRAGQRAFQALAEMTSPSDIMRVTGWDAATAGRVAKATDREGILNALAPEFGVSIDHGVGRIATGLRYKRQKAVERNRFYAAIERATGTFVPMGQRVDYADKDQMVQTLTNYMDYFGLPRETTRKYLDQIIDETDEFNQRNHVTGLFDELMDHMLTRAADERGISGDRLEHLRGVIKESTRVYRDSEKVGHEYWQERIAHDAWVGHILSNGETVRLPNAHIDSEFAQGGTVLPDPREMIESMGRVTGLIVRSDSTREAYEFAAKVTTDWWRTAMLVRGAYIIRNIAEEQIRMFLSGGQNVFANPLRMAAMSMAMRDSDGPMARLAAKFSAYDQGIDGTKFVVPHADNQELIDVHTSYLGMMMDNTSLLDSRVYRNAVARGIRMLRKTDDHFSSGWGHQLLALRASRAARLVVGDYPASLDNAIKAARKAGPVDEQRMVIDWLFNHPEGAEFRSYMGKSSPQMKKLMDDEQGAADYLFGPQGSVAARIDEFTAQNVELREFLRTGILKKNGETVWETAGRRVGPLYYSDNVDYDKFGNVLRNQYLKDIPESHHIEVPSQMGRDAFAKQDSIVDKFFNISAKMERSAALGPEWKYAYWEQIGARAHMLDAEALAAARKYADEVLPKSSPVRKQLADAKGDGHLTKDVVHEVAGKKAGEHVRDLFYDARRRNAAWHQTRLVFPFGQAWGNTMTTWSKLAAQHPEQVYKFSKAMIALQSQGSNAVYDAFNAVDPFGELHPDEDQGFFYNDPNRGDQLTFKYPMFATPLAGLMMSTGDVQMSMSSPVSSLNLAFSGDNPLPGLGPLAVGAVGATGITDKPGPIADMIRAMAYPFGEPDPETGLVESIAPAWVKHAVFGSGMVPGGGEAFRRAQQKGALMATASRNDYGDLTDPLNQKQWFADADGVARMASLIRGLGSFFLPTSPVPVWETKDKEGNWLPIASVAAQYRQQEQEYGNDRAIVNVVEQYGEKGLAALIASTSGQKPLSDDAYKFVLANPDAATSIGEDALAIMFPGDPSPITLAWQRANGQRRDLSWDEKQDAAMGLLYRFQMAEVYRAAADGAWDTDQIQEAKDAVLDRFGGKVPPRAFDPNYYDNLLQGIRNAVESPVASSIPSTATAAQALLAYDTVLANYRQHAGDPRATLGGSKAALWRDELHAELMDLLAADPSAAGVIDTLMSMTEER